MATRCYVMLRENETVKLNYVHNDGYIKNGVGQELLENFNSKELAEGLFIGDRSTLRSEKPFDDSDSETTVFDYSEIEEWIRKSETIEYFYLWDGLWKVRQKDDKEFRTLSL